jgi:hypothetical protein
MLKEDLALRLCDGEAKVQHVEMNIPALDEEVKGSARKLD